MRETAIGVIGCKPRMPGSQERSIGKNSPSEPVGGTNPAGTLAQTSGLWNCDTVNHCHFKKSSLWDFVMAAVGN